jgi:hypothetical protein
MFVRNRNLLGKWFLWLGPVLCLIVAAIWLVVRSEPSPDQPLPSPNGYEDLVNAAAALLAEPPDLKTADLEELRDYVEQNQTAFDLVRSGLKKKARVPTKTGDPNYLIAHSMELISLKKLCRALAACGQLAQFEQRTKDAVAAYLDVIQLGQHCSRGGLMIDALVGTAIGTIGADGLRRLLPAFEVQDCRRAIDVLERVEASAEPAEEFLKRDFAWARQQPGGWRAWLDQMIPLTRFSQLKQVRQSFLRQWNRQVRTRRQLLLDLALRRFELESGRKPSQLSELVPGCIKALPRDPETGKPLGQ